jgi:hypothetical protein
MSAYLASGQLQFRPVEDGRVAVPAGITYNSDAYQYTDLILTSGNVAPSAHRAVLTLESFEGGSPTSTCRARTPPSATWTSSACSPPRTGLRQVSITPSAANTPTSQAVTGLSIKGSTFYAFAAAQTSVPGSQVTGVGTTSVSSSGLTVWVTRTNTTATVVNWMVIGI